MLEQINAEFGCDYFDPWFLLSIMINKYAFEFLEGLLFVKPILSTPCAHSLTKLMPHINSLTKYMSRIDSTTDMTVKFWLKRDLEPFLGDVVLQIGGIFPTLSKTTAHVINRSITSERLNP